MSLHFKPEDSRRQSLVAANLFANMCNVFLYRSERRILHRVTFISSYYSCCVYIITCKKDKKVERWKNNARCRNFFFLIRASAAHSRLGAKVSHFQISGAVTDLSKCHTHLRSFLEKPDEKSGVTNVNFKPKQTRFLKLD